MRDYCTTKMIFIRRITILYWNDAWGLETHAPGLWTDGDLGGQVQEPDAGMIPVSHRQFGAKKKGSGRWQWISAADLILEIMEPGPNTAFGNT